MDSHEMNGTYNEDLTDELSNGTFDPSNDTINIDLPNFNNEKQ